MYKFGFGDIIPINKTPSKVSRSNIVFFPARVKSILLDKNNSVDIGVIHFTALQTSDSSIESNWLSARPYSSNFKNYPLLNEIVLIISGPGTGLNNTANDNIYYYLTAFNIWGSIHHNAFPDLNNTGSLQLGITEQQNIQGLMPNPGDVILEGRWGHSIRFGSTSTGDPSIIIRNKQSDSKEWLSTTEDINKDGSSLEMISNKVSPLVLSSKNFKSFNNNSLKYKPDLQSFKDEQLNINSDRIIINSKKDSIILSSVKSIALSSVSSINIDSDGPFVLNSSKAIYLGTNANEPILKGNQTTKLLSDILQDMSNICNMLKVLTGQPSGTPYLGLNFAATSFLEHMTDYTKRLQDIKSLKNFTE